MKVGDGRGPNGTTRSTCSDRTWSEGSEPGCACFFLGRLQSGRLWVSLWVMGPELLTRRQCLHVEGVIGVFGGCTEPLVKGEGKDSQEPKRCHSTACACPPASRGPGTAPHASGGWVLSLLGVACGSFPERCCCPLALGPGCCVPPAFGPHHCGSTLPLAPADGPWGHHLNSPGRWREGREELEWPGRRPGSPGLCILIPMIP